MRKFSVILVLVLFILSVFLINFFGVKLGSFEEKVLVESVTLLNTKVNNDDLVYIRVNKADFHFGYKYVFEYEILPLNATNKTVSFGIIAPEEHEGITISNTGVLTYNVEQVIDIRIIVRTLDGSNKNDNTWLLFR
ncbi:MAG: hypothetical protein LBM99_06630 [Bacillales bacterium]|jgi:hypothetical protein|nr:hypothetical protein [Bacillales bacterium]